MPAAIAQSHITPRELDYDVHRHVDLPSFWPRGGSVPTNKRRDAYQGTTAMCDVKRSTVHGCCHSIGFGHGINHRSLLGQTLVADTKLTVRDKRELDVLSARITCADAHRNVGVPNATVALGLRA
jgi:hypothetical protein